MAKEETIIKTGAYVHRIITLVNIKFPEYINDDEEVVKYKHLITIEFDVKGENIINPREYREYYSEPFDTMQTVDESLAWQSANILDFIYAGKNDIAGYIPQQ